MAKRFLEMLREEAIAIDKIYKTDVKRNRNSLQDKQKFESTDRCEHCNSPFKNSQDKCFDHDHHLGVVNLRKVLCKKCNFLFRKTNSIPVYFHNFSGYDSHLICTKLGYDEEDIYLIPSTSEKYVSISKKINATIGLRFLDTFKFLGASLDELVGNLPKEKIHDLREKISGYNIDKLTRKQVFCYDYLSSYDRLEEESLPTKADFFSILHNQEISDEDYQFAQSIWNDFHITTLKEYSSFYLKTDVILQADLFENFRSLCYSIYKLEVSWYVSIPRFSFDAMLRFSGIQLQLLQDYDMLLFSLRV